jgi:putative ATP-dependent endonuclease of OLD family
LKALNACDPYVNEFFFGAKSIVVEGDTEFTSFSLVKDEFPEKYRDIHIIKARGKGIIITLLKILNQFSSSYGVLHDADTPITPKGKGNPAWGMNKSILAGIQDAAEPQKIRHVTCIRNFEEAIFDEEARGDKPYNALLKIRDNQAMQQKVCALLDSLIDGDKEPPEGCVRWKSIEQLHAIIK